MNANTKKWLDDAMQQTGEEEITGDLIVFTIDWIDSLLDSVTPEERNTYLEVIKELEEML